MNVSAPGSDTDEPSETCVPSGDVAGAPTMATVGRTLSIVMFTNAVPMPPSSSVTWRSTRHDPSSSGVKSNVSAVPAAPADAQVAPDTVHT